MKTLRQGFQKLEPEQHRQTDTTQRIATRRLRVVKISAVLTADQFSSRSI